MRRRKWLRRGVIFFVVLVVLLYGAFLAFLFNPLEGDVESLPAIVPKEVTYMLHSPWGQLRATPLYDRHLAHGPLQEGLDDAFDLETTLYGPIRQMEEQVNASVPGFLGKFSVLDDMLGREVLLAGKLTGPGNDLESRVRNSPYVLLTRISFKAKFMEVLKYGFVRDQIPGLRSYPNYFEYDVGLEHIQRGSPDSARFVYFRRIRDVLVLSNDRELMEETVRLGVAGGDQEISRENLPYGNYYFYHDLREAPQEAGITVWLELARADAELDYLLEGIGREPEGTAGDYLKALFPVGLTSSLTLLLGTSGPDEFSIGGSARLTDRHPLPPHIDRFHNVSGQSLTEAVGHMAEAAPREGHLAFLWLNMTARDLLLTVFSSLDKATKDLAFSTEEGGWTEAELAAEVGEWFQDGAGLAFARLPEMDDVDFDTYAGGDLIPTPAVTIVFKRKAALSEDALVEFFRRNADRFPWETPEEIEAPTGRLFRADVVVDRKLRTYEPGFAFVGDLFVFSTNLGQLRRILEAAGGDRPALAADESFRDALAAAPAEGSLFLHLDGETLAKVVRDYRWEVAFDETTMDWKKYRTQEIVKLTQEYPDWDLARRNEEADRLVRLRMEDNQLKDFPKAVQAYEDTLFWSAALQDLWLASRVARDQASAYQELSGRLRLRPAEEAR